MLSTTIDKKKRLAVDAPPLAPCAPDALVSTAVAGKIEISVHHDLNEIETLWREFEQTGVCTVYQRFDWAANWLNTAGKANHAKPYIVVGKAKNKPVFLYPFTLFNHGLFSVVYWIGGSHSNFNMGIYEAEFLDSVRMEDMRAIFDHIFDSAENVDAFELCCQPVSWQNHNNPLNFLGHMASPNHAFSMQLHTSFNDVLAQHNPKKKRKKFRWQMRALEALGGYKVIRTETPEEINALLDASLAQIEVRQSKIGVFNMFSEPGIRTFFNDLALSSIGSKEPSLVLYGLEIDGKIRATFAGGGHQGRFSGCFTSIATDELTYISPGELLLYLVIEDCTKRGYQSFDLGRGQERYKSSWCNEVLPMFESFFPVTRKATVLVVYESTKVTIKRLIKQNPTLWRLAKYVRARLHRRHQHHH